MMKFLGPLFVLLALLAGCTQTDKSLEAEDETNPHIREALAAQREFNFVDAAKDYEAALQASPKVARAHFDLGLLYADRLNDPIRAMYHFKCYIEQRPQADNLEGAEKRLESIKIQFAATVPNSPIQNAEVFAKLQSDNQNLLKDLDDARTKISGLEDKLKTAAITAATDSSTLPSTPTVAQNTPPVNPVKDGPDVKSESAAANPDPAPVAVTPAVSTPTPANSAPSVTPKIETNPNPPSLAQSAPTDPVANTQPTPPSTPATPAGPSDRTHTIAKGDTLWSIAKKYYPGQITAGIDKIKNANPDKLADGKPLKIGVVLAIP